MWKKSRTPLVLTILIAVAAALFSWKLNFLNVPVKLGLESITGQRVSFQRIEYRFFNRITIRNISIGASFKARDITVYINPLRVLTSLKTPENALHRIHLNTPQITVTPELVASLKKLTATNGMPAHNAYRISWEMAHIEAPGVILDKLNGQVHIRDGVTGRMAGYLGGDLLTARLSLTTLDANNSSARVDAELKGPETDVVFHSEHTISSGTIVSSFEVPVLRRKYFDVHDTTGTFIWSPAGFSAGFRGPAGMITAESTRADSVHVQADIFLQGILSDSSGTLHVELDKAGTQVHGMASAEGVAVQNYGIGGGTVVFHSKSNAEWSADVTVWPAGYAITAHGRGLKDITAALTAPAAGSGTVHGALFPLDLGIDIYNWPVRNFPGTLRYQSGLSGMIDARGVLRGRDSSLTVNLRKLQVASNEPLSIQVRAFQKVRSWFITAESISRSGIWRIAGRKLVSGVWNADIFLDRCKAQQILPIFGSPLPVKGTVSGKVTYGSDGKSEARLSLSDLYWGQDYFGNGRLHVVISPDEIRIRDTSLHAGKGTITVDAHVALSETLKTSQAVVRMHHFPVRGKPLHGDIRYSGTINETGSRDIAGVIESSQISLGNILFQNIRIPLAVNNERITINSMAVNSAIKGNLSVLLKKSKALSGCFSLTAVPLTGLAPDLSGVLQGTVVLSGTLSKPLCVAALTVGNGRFRDLNFGAEGTVRVADRSIHIEHMQASSGESALSVDGTIWPALKLRCMVRGVHAGLLNKVTRAPALSGVISGSSMITGTLAEPAAAATLRCTAVSIDQLRLDELTLRAVISAHAIVIKAAEGKLGDSEVRLSPDSSISFIERQFSVGAELRNIHAAIADLFGTVKCTGSWEGDSKNPLLRSRISVSNLWINQYFLKAFSFDIASKDKKITFSTRDNQAARLSGKVNLSLYPQLAFDHFLLAQGDSQLSINGNIGNHFWNFSVDGRALNVATAAEIFGSPVPLAGAADISVIGKGAVDAPQLDARIDVSPGSIAEIPLDSVHLQLSVRRDVVTITSARFLKSRQYEIAASGFMPFFITKERQKAVVKNPMDITVNVGEGSLELLKGITPEITAASGELRSQVRFTGTPAKPVVNGYVRITNGEVSAARYLKTLSRLNIDMQWKDNTLMIKEFTGRAGNGILRMKGGASFDGLKPATYSLTLFTEGKNGVPISVPELPIKSPLLNTGEWKLLSTLSHGEPRFLVQVSGSGDAPLLSGWTELENTHFTYPPPPVRQQELDDPLAEFWPLLSWDLTLRTGKNCWYENELVSVNVNGSIHLTGKGATPKAAGRIESVRGNITYLGTEFKIKQAVVEIVKDAVFLEGEASTEVYGTSPSETDTIQMFIDKAEIGKIMPRFVSKNDAKMTPEKALSRATGVDPERVAGSDQGFLLRQQLIRLFDSTLTTPLAKNLLRKSGLVDTFRVQYQTQEPITPSKPGNPTLTELLYGTKYSLEKYVTDQILFGYSVTFDQLQNRLDLRHELEVSYQLQRNIFLKGIYELESRNPDRQHDRRITLEQQWRFGWPKKKS